LRLFKFEASFDNQGSVSFHGEKLVAWKKADSKLSAPHGVWIDQDDLNLTQDLKLRMNIGVRSDARA
jgi:hypothetical protein